MLHIPSCPWPLRNCYLSVFDIDQRKIVTIIWKGYKTFCLFLSMYLSTNGYFFLLLPLSEYVSQYKWILLPVVTSFWVCISVQMDTSSCWYLFLSMYLSTNGYFFLLLPLFEYVSQYKWILLPVDTKPACQQFDFSGIQEIIAVLQRRKHLRNLQKWETMHFINSYIIG
jgi:hypothetical protein